MDFTFFTTNDHAAPYGIALGADRNIWFTQNGANKIGVIKLNNNISEYHIPVESAEPH